MTGGGERLTNIFRWIVLRLFEFFDPRTQITYRRSVVESNEGVTAVEKSDLPNLRVVTVNSGYVEDESDTRYIHRWFRIPVEISIRPQQSGENAEVVEEIKLPGLFNYILLVGFLALFSWVYFPRFLGNVLLLTASVIFLSFLCGFLFIPSPLTRYLDSIQATAGNDNTSNNSFIDLSNRDVSVNPHSFRTSCIGPSMTALFGGIAASGPVFFTGWPLIWRQVNQSPYVSSEMVDTWLVFPITGIVWLLGFWVLSGLLGLFIYTFEDNSARIQVFPFDVLNRFNVPVPELSGGYLSFLGVATLPVFALANSYFLLPAVYRLSPLRLRLYFLLPALILVITFPVFLYWWVVQNREYVYQQTISQLNELDSPVKRVTVLSTIVVLSYVLLWSIGKFVGKYRSYLITPILNENYLPIIQKPLLMIILITSILPAVYLLTGAVYQLLITVLLLVWDLSRSRVVGKSPTTGARVRMLPDESPRSFALSVGPWSAIIVSRGLYDELETREQFAAILAHEEAHLLRDGKLVSDAQLGFFLPFLGTLTITGKNILYALADFRTREEQADDYAARTIGANHLSSALITLSGNWASQAPGVMSAPMPAIQTPAPLSHPRSVLQATERYFGLLFGTFAMTRAHPDLGRRINRLDGGQPTD